MYIYIEYAHFDICNVTGFVVVSNRGFPALLNSFPPGTYVSPTPVI